MATAYDRLAYPNHVHRVTYPGRFAALATLCGRSPPPLEKARVLEVGCSGGANLLSIAAGLPGCECIGFDLAATAIEEARALASLSGLTNVAFHVADIRDAAVDGSFDYIIVHGIYSWVPADVRAAVMSLIGRALSPNGVALVSYNVFPGCRSRHAIRDILLETTRGLSDPREIMEAARSVLERLATALPPEDQFPNAVLEEVNEKLKRSLRVLFHDELGEVWEPQIFGDVLKAARANGLTYLCDMSQRTLEDALRPTADFEAARPHTGGDWEAYEQWTDFAHMRRFRLSVFARDNGQPVDRRADPRRLADLHATGRLERVERDGPAYRTGEKVDVSDGGPEATRLLDQLAAAQPGSLSLASVADSADQSAAVFDLFLLNGVTLSTVPDCFTLTAGERPLASPVARAFASRQMSALPSLAHRIVQIEDDMGRHFLQLLDGTRTRADLVAAMAAMSGQSQNHVAPTIEAGLRAFAHMALLQA